MGGVCDDARERPGALLYGLRERYALNGRLQFQGGAVGGFPLGEIRCMDGVQVLRCRIEQDALVAGQLGDVVGGVAVGWQRLCVKQAPIEVYVFAEQEGGWRAANAAVEAGVDNALGER